MRVGSRFCRIGWIHYVIYIYIDAGCSIKRKSESNQPEVLEVEAADEFDRGKEAVDSRWLG